MKIYKIVSVLLFLLLNFCKGIELNVLSSSIENSGITFKLYVDEFNKYAKDNNIDIQLKLNLLTIYNFSVSMENTNMMFESLLKKKESKYDIYFYDSSYNKQLCPYLIDLSEHIDKNHISLYDENIISQICRCQNGLMGLPLILGYEALYSNKIYLEKYNKKVPKTWKELYETGKEILEKEREKNNTSLIGYNGLFFDSEIGICSLYEFLYSCRKKVDSPFPDLTSEEVLEGVTLLKKIKNELANDEIFNSGLEYSFQRLIMGDAIFLKFFIYYTELIRKDSPYEMTNIPGMQEGVTGTILTGYNIGIAKNMDKSKLESAIEVVKYMTSKELQKSLVLQQMTISAMTSLYDDEEVCANIKNCKLYVNAQPIVKPVDKTDDFNVYSEKFTSYFYEYLYRNMSASDALKAMDDLTRIYYIWINTKETYLGLLLVIIFTITIVLMISSLIFLNFKNFEQFYIFLSKPSWSLIVIGISLILSSGYTKLGMVSNFKCQLNYALFSLGYSFIYIPILCKLIILFPEENKYSKWTSNNKYKFILSFIFINFFLNGLSFISSYEIEDVIINEGENFQKLNYMTLYGIRLILPGLMKKNYETEIIEKIRVHQSSYDKSDNIHSSATSKTFQTHSTVSKVSTKSNSLYSKILEYHYSQL